MATKTFCKVAAVGDVEATPSVAFWWIWIVDVSDIDTDVNGWREECPDSREVMMVWGEIASIARSANVIQQHILTPVVSGGVAGATDCTEDMLES